MATFDEQMLGGVNVFRTIVEHGSFTAAADVLAMSQPGVSRSIARLEHRLGVRLFERTSRSVRLTHDGRQFHERVHPLLQLLEDAAEDTVRGASAVHGRLRVNVDPQFSRLILGPRLGAFLKSYPQLQVELISRDSLGDPMADAMDLAVRFGQPRDSALVARKLLDTRIVTAAAPMYLKAHGWPTQPGDLESGHRCVQFRDSQSGRPFAWEFHRKRKRLVLNPPGNIVVNDAATHQSICAAGYGVAQLMELAIHAQLADGSLVDLFPDWPDERFPLYALYPSREHLPAKTRAFMDFIIALVGGR
jgi:DNA-binding transcriptional LysR family regulator